MALSPELTQLRDVVKEVANIVVVAENLRLTGQEARGRNNVFISCPFHPETDASCALHPGYDTHFRDYNTFHCFGCSRSGDVISFWREIRGYDATGPGFLRAVADLCELFDPAVSERLPDWQQIVSGNLPLGALQAVLAALEGLPVGPTLEVDGPAGGMRRLQSRVMHALPRGTESMLLDPARLRLPALAWTVPEMSAIALTERGTGRFAGVFSTRENANFTHVRNPPGLYKGQMLNGKQAPADAPSLVSLRLTVENPLDALVLSRARVPVRWGCWQGPFSRRALNQGGGLLAIQCLVAVLFEGDSEAEERFLQVITPGWGLRWIPRMVHVAGHTLVGKPVAELEELALSAVSGSQAPAWSEPF